MRLFCVSALILLVFGACSEPIRTVTVRRFEPVRKAAIFNTQSNDYILAYNDRFDWPVTQGNEAISGYVEFREVVQDIQSRNPVQFEAPYRRFYSVRRGFGQH